MSSFFSKIISGYLATSDPNHMEAVWQAPCMYCYHASSNDVTLVDVGHPVVQVSGAADHVWGDLFLGTWRWKCCGIVDI